MVTLAQIGCGYWGPNLLRNFLAHRDVRVKFVAEVSRERRRQVEENFRGVVAIEDYRQILDDSETSAVAVATDAGSHFAVVKEVLEAGKDCFVEKPLATSVPEAEELCRIAEKLGRILMVGHVFLYNDAVRTLKQLLDRGEIGETYYVHAQRLNLGIVRRDVNVMWSLAPHDVSILLYLLGSKATAITAHGVSYLQPNVEDVVYMHLTFEHGVSAHIHLSWLDPSKTRRMTLVGSRKMIVYDDAAEAKIQIYDKGIDRHRPAIAMEKFTDFGEFQLIQRAGDILMPKIEFREPLRSEISHFLQCVTERTKPLSDGRFGLEVVKILEAAEISLHSRRPLPEVLDAQPHTSGTLMAPSR